MLITKINLNGHYYVTQGFGKVSVNLNVNHNREILLSAVNFDHDYHLALKLQQVSFEYHDLYTNKICIIKTPKVQRQRQYQINHSDMLAVVAKYDIKKNKTYVRLSAPISLNELYRLVNNYHDAFKPANTKEVMNVINGLHIMRRCAQKKFETKRQLALNKEINLNGDELGLIVMSLQIAAHDNHNSLRQRTDLRNLLISVIKMIQDGSQLPLSKVNAKKVLRVVKNESNFLFHILKLSLTKNLKVNYTRLIHDLESFIHPKTLSDLLIDNLNHSVKLAKKDSVQKALDYIFRKDPNDMGSIIGNEAEDVLYDGLKNNKYIFLVSDVIKDIKHQPESAQNKGALNKLKQFHHFRIKYFVSTYVNDQPHISKVNHSVFDSLVQKLRKRFDKMNY